MIFGTDGLFSPGTFTINGSYVSSFGPDITAIPADASIAAAAKAKYGELRHVRTARVRGHARASTRRSRRSARSVRRRAAANVLAAIKATNEPTSILGQPISSPPTATSSAGSSSCSRSTRRASTCWSRVRDRLTDERTRRAPPRHAGARRSSSHCQHGPRTACTFVQELVNGLTTGSLYALIALGYSMVYGVLKLLNFAHGDLYMVGAFVGYFVIQWFGGSQALSIPVPLLLADHVRCSRRSASALLGVAIERFAYRPLRDAPRIAPLITALGVVVLPREHGPAAVRRADARLQHARTSSRSRTGSTSACCEIDVVRIMVIVLSVVLMVGLRLLVNRTTLGKSMRAVASDREAAEMLGINVDLTISTTFFLGSALAGVAGVMAGLVFNQVTTTIGFIAGLKAFTAAVVGGIGSIPGAMLGGLLDRDRRVVHRRLHLVDVHEPDRVRDPDRRRCCCGPCGLLGRAQLQKV